MSNVLSEEKRQQVIALGRLGWPLRRIQVETGVRRETAGAYLKAAGVAIRPPGAWGRRPPAKPANGVTPDSGAAPPAISKPANEVPPDSGPPPEPGCGPTASACEPHRAFIEISLSKGRNAKAIYQDLVDDHGFRGAYQSVKRFVHRLRGSPVTEACAVIVTPPGEEAQVDYGSGPMVRDPHSGRYRRTRMFVLTLGYSRKAVRLLTFQSSTRVWAELHEQAFRRLGGATRTVVLDNLREGILKPDIYDPALNPLYRDMLAHYGAIALPCRVRDPDRKGKVERSVGHAKNTPLKGLRFESLAEAQSYLDRWERNWADTRIHGTTKRQVAAMFAEEKPALLALPVEPFRFYQFGERRVNLDGCVEVNAAYYSAPPGWIGRDVKVQWDQRTVRVLDPRTGQLLREHLHQQRGQHRIPDEDRPAHAPRSTQQLLARCAKAGPHIGALCQLMYREQNVVAIRRIQGILGLARRHGAALTDDGCAAALEIGVSENPYRFVRRWLERRPQLTLRQVDPIIRQLTLYRDLIDNRTQENPT
ncbi:MAG: IS21 family transposase [Bryobacterales bacterium]|nr:IS21 family transposase [Bryobacterales bacterium]